MKDTNSVARLKVVQIILILSSFIDLKKGLGTPRVTIELIRLKDAVDRCFYEPCRRLQYILSKDNHSDNHPISLHGKNVRHSFIIDIDQ